MSVFAGIFMSIIASLGSILNLVVLGTLWMRRKTLTPVELCIINMSIAGLIPALVSYPMYASSCFADKWMYGYVGFVSGHIACKSDLIRLEILKANISACVMDGFIVYFFGMVGIATLTAIAAIRLINTQRTCRGGSSKQLTNGHAVLVILTTYLYASIWTIPPFFGWGTYGPEPTGLNCAVRWNQLSASYFITVFMFGYVTPLFLIILCFVRMNQLMKQTTKKTASFVAKTLKNRQLRSDKLLLKFGVFTCTTFFLTWTPYAVVSFLAYFNLHVFLTKTASLFPSLFAKSSVLVNPVIYFFMVKRFRREASSWLSSMRMTSTSVSDGEEKKIEIEMGNNIGPRTYV